MMLQKIIWDDAGSFDIEGSPTWKTLEDVVDAYNNGNFVAVTVGIVVHEDDNSIILCQSSEEFYGQYSQPFRIPKKMVLAAGAVCSPATICSKRLRSCMSSMKG